MESIDFACTIDPAGLEQRVNQLDSLVPQVVGLRRDGLTLALAFPAEAAQDVRAFVVEESKCCPFFSFEIDEIDLGLRLGIRTPPGGEAMLEALQTVFAGNAAKLRAKLEAVPRQPPTGVLHLRVSAIGELGLPPPQPAPFRHDGA